MPPPIGGAFALAHSMGRTNYFGSEYDHYDPGLEEFREQERFFQENINCGLKFLRSVIPPGKGKVEGVLVLEAKEDIEHSGIFILMKGLPLDPKKKRGRKPLSNVKFTVLGSTYTGAGQENGGEYMQIDENCKETYPLDLEIPDELPPPLMTSEGKLIYRMQVFISTLEGRHVKVGEAPIRLQGCRVLMREEIEKPLTIEQQVLSRRSILALGRRKSCGITWRVGRSGYVAGEVIRVELTGECKDKVGMPVECMVELVQKVWYQVPAKSGRGKMWVNMKVNVLAIQESEPALEVEGGGGENVIWMGRLKVPRGITPTYKFDFMNSVSYTIRVTVGVAGESKEGWVKGEVPLLIGTSKEVVEEDETKTEEGNTENVENEEEEELELGSPSAPNSRGSVSPAPPEEMLQRRRSGGSTGTRRSQSMTFIPSSWVRPRAGSVSSMESFQSLASSTLSMFRLPPSYSQLSSRRPTLETLPPAYGDLELGEQRPLSQQEGIQESRCSSSPANNTECAADSNEADLTVKTQTEQDEQGN